MEQEFITLIKENERIILKICNLYCKKEEDREDLYQDIIIQLWKSFPTFNNKSKITTWLYKVALNTAISRYRKHKKIPAKEKITEHIGELPSPEADNLEEDIKLLYAAIESLSDVEKAIIMLFMEDTKQKEIAEIIGISVSNVGFKVHQIKRKLRDKLKIEEL